MLFDDVTGAVSDELAGADTPPGQFGDDDQSKLDLARQAANVAAELNGQGDPVPELTKPSFLDQVEAKLPWNGDPGNPANTWFPTVDPSKLSDLKTIAIAGAVIAGAVALIYVAAVVAAPVTAALPRSRA